MVDPNTRQGKRTPVTLKIKFKSETLEQFIERYAVDVSQGGIFIRTKEPLAVGTQMKFEFQLRDASPLIAGEGTVVWTRENDPSRPAIAPGMGVRFDRLAEGSQGILERILSEKAKQAPQRPASETAKPPLFTDTPTRVAPTPMQEALLGKDRPRRVNDDHNDSHTPLPKPMPFHSDADEFPEEAFEEATKVRALDELIAKTAEGTTTTEEPAPRRSNGRTDTTVADPPTANAEPRFAEASAPAGAEEPQEAPTLPNPPEAAARPQPKLLDTSPSPRNEPAFVSESLAKTRLGVEPARGRVTPSPPVGQPVSQPITELPPMPSPMPSGMRAVAAEPTEPARMPAMKAKSSAPILILLLLIVAAGGAAAWFFVIRPKQAVEQPQAPGSNQPNGSGIATTGSGATTGSAAVGSAATGSAGQTGSAGLGSTSPPPPKVELVDTVIGSSTPGSTVEVTGTDQAGPAPFTAKLEKDKPYKVRVTAHGFLALQLDVKGGEAPQTTKLLAKPRVISVDSDPQGALIFVDGGATGKMTPNDIELTEAQAAKKAVRVKIRKPGYLTVDRVVEIAKLTEDDARMVTKLDEKLTIQTAVRPGSGAGSGKGSAQGSDASSGSPPENPPPSGGSGQDSSGGSAAPPPPPPPPSGGSTGSASEPEPSFNKTP